jgi:hypothetical protein
MRLWPVNRTELETTPPAPPRTYEFKSRNRRHTWKVTGGYDPDQDGDEPRWGRVAIECTTCGETRRVGRDAYAENAIGLRYGCLRTSTSPQFERGDLVALPDGRLDEFVAYLSDDMAVTYNAGGHSHEERVEDLKVYR